MMSWSKQVLEYFQQKESPFPTVADKDTTWEEYERRANFTKNIEYDCQFGINGPGTCRSNPNAQVRKGMSCCEGCAYANGYLETIPPGTAKYYAKLFRKTTGFWRAGKGCVLPRKRRSAVCLNYRCASPKYDTRSADLPVGGHSQVYYLNQTPKGLYVWGYLTTGNIQLIQIALKEKS